MAHVDIADFEDYRGFLKARIQELKAQKSVVSHAFIAQRLKLTRGFVTLLLQSKRHLGPDKISKFWKILGLSGWEKEYFVSLYLKSSIDDEELRSYFDSVCKTLLMERAQYGSVRPDSHRYRESEYLLITDPICATLMTLTRFPGFDPSPEWVLKRLRSTKLKASDLKKAWDQLVAAKMLVPRELPGGKVTYDLPDSIYRESSPHAQDSSGAPYEASVATIQESLSQRTLYRPLRNWVATVPLDENQHLELLKILGSFEEQLSALAASAKKPSQVTHISLHFLTMASEPKGKA